MITNIHLHFRLEPVIEKISDYFSEDKKVKITKGLTHPNSIERKYDNLNRTYHPARDL